jgi:signal transduction histidine kinase
MQLSSKLALTLVLGISAVMSTNAYVRVRREVALFESDQVEDQHNEGRVLATILKDIEHRDGELRVRQLVRDAEGSGSAVQLDWVALDAGHPRPERGHLTAHQREALQRGLEITLVQHDAAGDARRTIYIPVLDEGAPPAALALSESPSPPASYVRTSVLQSAISALLAVGICGAFAAATGSWFVGRPLRRLCEKARRVGEGDFTGRLDFPQRDEVGRLAAEIDAMCDRLADATARAAAESGARIAALEQLRHADRVKTVGQLASGVAHELGTPLTVVVGRARMIAAGELDARVVEECTHSIVEQCERMTGIIRQLLDFSRRRQPKPGASDAVRIARRVLDLVAPLADERGIAACLDGPEEPLMVALDENQVLQALANVVVNGIQAMPGGGRLALGVARADARPPSGGGGAERPYVVITVDDEGAGIPPDALPHIFEPFFTTKAVGEGTGLGLSVADGIVRDHGGWIEVDSAVGRGSRFTIYLRAASVARAATVALT